MTDSTIQEETLNALYQVETAIIDSFKSMLANDAMLSIEMELQEIKTADPAEVIQKLNGPVQWLQSDLEWNAQNGRNVFFMRDEDANTFLAQVTVQNEALDSLDVIFDNWNVAATQFFEEKLGQPPAFGQVNAETRELQEDAVQADELWAIYTLKLGDNIKSENIAIISVIPSLVTDLMVAINKTNFLRKNGR